MITCPLLLWKLRRRDRFHWQCQKNSLPCRRKYVHPIDGQRFPGPHRVIIGSDGEIYYTPDHYQTFLNQIEMYYYTDIEEINVEDNCYLARIQLEPEETESSMFSKYYNVLHFPDYFGFNWDAFDECISDLSWIDKSFICIVHSPLNVSDKEFLYRYLKCIDDVEKEWAIFINSIDDNPQNAWKRQYVKYVRFYFHECDRERICSTLKK